MGISEIRGTKGYLIGVLTIKESYCLGGYTKDPWLSETPNWALVKELPGGSGA